jgi:hypothetical protein
MLRDTLAALEQLPDAVTQQVRQRAERFLEVARLRLVHDMQSRQPDFVGTLAERSEAMITSLQREPPSSELATSASTCWGSPPMNC